jgi:hypothetical protein
MALRERLHSPLFWYRFAVLGFLVLVSVQLIGIGSDADSARRAAREASEMAQFAAEAAKHAGEKAEQAISDLEVAGIQCR